MLRFLAAGEAFSVSLSSSGPHRRSPLGPCCYNWTMSRRKDLREFLLVAFVSSDDFMIFVEDCFPKARHELPQSAGLNQQVHDFVMWLETQGRTGDLWPLLRSERPARVAEIDLLANRFAA